MRKVEISQIQKQFWVLQNVYKTNTAYNIPAVFKTNGIPDIDALEYSVNQVISRHEILRTYFTEQDNKVYQTILNEDEARISLTIVRLFQPFVEDELHDKIMEEIHTVFDLAQWPLLRLKLFRFDEDVTVLTIVFHHIIVDLHSKMVFAEELSEFYNSYKAKHSQEKNNRPLSYQYYADWESGWLGSEEALRMKSEWKKFIPITPDNLEIPSDFPKPVLNSLAGKRKHFKLGSEHKGRVLNLAERNSVNPFSVLLTAYAIMLYRLTNQTDIIIGVPLTNRRRPEFKNTFGCFVNIVPVLVKIKENITGSELLKQIRQSLLTVHRIQEIPFLILNDLIKNKGSLSVLQTGFTFEPHIQLSLRNLNLQPVVVEKNGSQLDLFMTLWEQEDDFYGYLEYSSRLFSDSSAKRFIEIFKKIILSFSNDTESLVSDLDIVPENEMEQISGWNHTEHTYNNNICLHQKFEEQVKKIPEKPALLFGNNILTYHEFDRCINSLANYLIEVGIIVEDLLSICMERSPELMIAIYAIHKAGAVYLPIDPKYPLERMEMILSDAKPKFVLTKKNSDTNLPEGFAKIYLDKILTSPLSDNFESPRTEVNSKNLAYLMYTSGSTGKPKGVMIEHHSVINKLEWMQFQHPLTSEDTVLLKTPVTFDVSVWEIFWWMFNGARLAILPHEGEKDPRKIIHEIEDKKVTTVVFVPSMFAPFVEYIKANGAATALKSLKWIIQIGEALSPQLVNSFNELLTPDFNPLMVNTYGPTEATVAVSWYNCPKTGNIEKIYIGKPIFNTKLLVLNEKNRIQPIGAAGELVITGVNLSRGYLNRPDLNAEKFINLKFTDGQMLRAYKTGDLVKWTDDGNIDFIGRADTQVKIRGYRIELGDIESKLLDHPEIKTAAVTVDRTNPDNNLIIGYVVLKVKGSSTVDKIRLFPCSQTSGLYGPCPSYDSRCYAPEHKR